MSKARVLADFISDGSEFADGTISVAEVSGAAPLASPTFTGTPKADSSFEIEGSSNAILTLDETNGVAGGAQSTYISMQAAGSQTAYMGVASGGGIMYVTNEYGPLNLMTGTSGSEQSRLLMYASNEAVFNEASLDYDFRVESDTWSHMLFLDASNNNVNIKNAVVTDAENSMNIRGNIRLGADTATRGDTIRSAGGASGAYNGMVLMSNHINQSDQANTSLPSWLVDIGGSWADGTNFPPSTADGITIARRAAGGAKYSSAKYLGINATATIINEDSNDHDFRVESDANANALVIDAGYNSGKGAAIFGSNSAPETGTDYYIAASMLKYSDAQPVMATGAAWNFPSVPSNRQAQADRWRFMGFTLPYHGSNGYRADSSYAQFVCELPNGGSGGKTNLELFEIGFNYGWSSGFYMVEVYENYYINSGYKKYIFHGGYNPSFTLYENYGNNSISLNVLSEGTFQDGTSSVPSSVTDASYYRKTVRATYGAYYGGMVVLTVPSWNELTLNAAEVDNGSKIRLLNPQ